MINLTIPEAWFEEGQAVLLTCAVWEGLIQIINTATALL